MMMDPRRELRRQYKESQVPAGIYAIRNLSSGRLLLGASMNLAGALNRHRFELVQGSHRNRGLQQDWNRLGADAFAFETIDHLKHRPEPEFDAEAELAILLALWKHECEDKRRIAGDHDDDHPSGQVRPCRVSDSTFY